MTRLLSKAAVQRGVLLLLAVCMLMSAFTGCNGNSGNSSGPDNVFSGGKDPSAPGDAGYVVPDTLLNIVKDGNFQNGGEGWYFEGCGVTDTMSRNLSEKGCLEFKKSGYALFKISGVPAGRYSLRYWTYENGGSISSADGTIYVNGEAAVKTTIANRGWWYEICTDAFTVPEGAELSFKIQVKGNAGLSYCVDGVQILKVPYEDKDIEPFVSASSVSRLVKKEDGSFYTEVNGKPEVISLTHAVDGTTTDVDFLAEKIKAVGYNTFGNGIAWSDLMKGVSYEDLDFKKIDEIIRVADKHDMYAAINFTGSNCIGTVRSAPGWLKGSHPLHLHDEKGECIKVTFDENTPPDCIGDPGNEKLLEHETKIVKAMMDYITEHDKNHRIIIMGFYCEASVIVNEGHFMTHEKLAKYISEMAKVVKESGSSMITAVNHGFGIAPHFIYNTPYLDMNGSDPYSDSMNVVIPALSTFNSKIPHLWENGGFANSSYQQAAAFAVGGFVSVYPVGPDTYWGRTGLYGDKFSDTIYTPKLRSLNTGMAKIAQVFAPIPNANRTAYNHEKNRSTTNFKGTKKLGGYSVRMEAKSRNGAVGLAGAEGNYVYAIADNAAFFAVTAESVKVTAGYIDANGSWVAEREITPEDCKDGSWRAEYVPGEALRFEMG